MAEHGASEPLPERRPRVDPAARRQHLTGLRRSCGCRRPAAGRPGCMRLHIPRIHLQV